ncbi:hypothetical protein CPY51_07355 [Rhizobium tubonense]|uniref:Aquaporin family protein n=1 Tax=Rhizobium tubonense TaxID=484088 RepID=A0A2W4EPD6_9HYPH|nr:hypothetical protein CPY51_07355 [Rhizobium tubonense]
MGSRVLLGAIVAPPDPVAPIAIASTFPVPSRVLTIIECEGLVNATTFVLVGFTSAAIHGASVNPVASISRYVVATASEVGWRISMALTAIRVMRSAGDTRIAPAGGN